MSASERTSPIDPVKLDRLAEVAIKVGLRLEPGQDLLVTAPTVALPLVRRVAEHAYRAGAGLVTPIMSDEAREASRKEIEAAVAPGTDVWVFGYGSLMWNPAIHVVETGKFVTAWSRYLDAIAGLAMGNESDPDLGDPRFVSSGRAAPDLAPMEWFSTIPYLSVIISNFRPNRLVIHPTGNYFWLSCTTATRNRDRQLAVPVQARELIRVYSCLHR